MREKKKGQRRKDTHSTFTIYCDNIFEIIEAHHAFAWRYYMKTSEGWPSDAFAGQRYMHTKKQASGTKNIEKAICKKGHHAKKKPCSLMQYICVWDGI